MHCGNMYVCFICQHFLKFNTGTKTILKFRTDKLPILQFAITSLLKINLLLYCVIIFFQYQRLLIIVWFWFRPYSVRSQHLAENILSRVVRKPAFCICENKDADQLRGNREADQRLCFCYIDSTIPLLYKSEISSL